VYRINLVLMVALSLAVVGAAVFLSIAGEDSVSRERQYQERLLTRLADTDPDISREACEEILAMGPEAIPLLRKALDSDDQALAERAGKVLGDLLGGEPETAVAREPAPAGEPKAASGVDPTARFEIEAHETQIAAGEGPRFTVRFFNGGPVPVQVAYQNVDGFVSIARFGWFEVEDAGGNTTLAPVEWLPDGVDLASLPIEFAVVDPAEAHDLYTGQAGGPFCFARLFAGPGVYRVRFVYDASEEGVYREAVASSDLPAMPLPAGPVVSNAVTITVLAAR
jgi:hypothetical protein